MFHDDAYRHKYEKHKGGMEENHKLTMFIPSLVRLEGKNYYPDSVRAHATF